MPVLNLGHEETELRRMAEVFVSFGVITCFPQAPWEGM